MAKRNYYQHCARQKARKLGLTGEQKDAYTKGYEDGFELALETIDELIKRGVFSPEIWRDVWTNILTDDSEWD